MQNIDQLRLGHWPIAVADPEGGLKQYSQLIFTIEGIVSTIYGENEL